MSCSQKLLPLLPKISSIPFSDPRVATAIHILNAGAGLVYEQVLDRLAYRIAYHIHVLEKKEKC
jgi:hypothetical protein